MTYNFTPTEATKLNYEWSNFAKDYKVNGMVVFTNLFRKHTDYPQLFETFGPKSWEALSNNVRLMCHSQYVMKNVGESVKLAGNKEALDKHLLQLGGEHVCRKVGQTHFGNIYSIIQDQLVITNGGKLSKELWTRFFAYLTAKMGEGTKSPKDYGPTPSDNAIKDVFIDWDTDRDGALNHDDLFQIMSNICEGTSADDIKKMIKAADTNNDGLIQFDEFLAVFRK